MLDPYNETKNRMNNHTLNSKIKTITQTHKLLMVHCSSKRVRMIIIHTILTDHLKFILMMK